jgi:hypothetical protein
MGIRISVALLRPLARRYPDPYGPMLARDLLRCAGHMPAFRQRRDDRSIRLTEEAIAVCRRLVAVRPGAARAEALEIYERLVTVRTDCDRDLLAARREQAVTYASMGRPQPV